MAVSLADFDYKKQTREVKNRTDGARISNLNKNDALVSCVFEDGKTLHELFLRGKRISSKIKINSSPVYILKTMSGL